MKLINIVNSRRSRSLEVGELMLQEGTNSPSSCRSCAMLCCAVLLYLDTLTGSKSLPIVQYSWSDYGTKELSTHV